MGVVPASPGRRWRDALLARWFGQRRGALVTLLRPLGGLYLMLAARRRRADERAAASSWQPPCPVIVIGNLVVGGAGKTPTAIAVVQALRDAGRHPGVVSRGYGRMNPGAIVDVQPDDDAARCGDEPLLIRRRAGVPVVVGRDRIEAARRLLSAHPEVDVVVADDGLQHRRLRREVEIVVFDDRGLGNGLPLPAGPLREAPSRRPGPRTLVLYNAAAPSTPWPGACAERRLGGTWTLAGWDAAVRPTPQPLAALRGRRLLAVAGIAVPERFFAALEGAGLTIDRLPLPDHHDYTDTPWPAGTREVITTEKDAVKLRRLPLRGAAVWVVGLDLVLPEAFRAELLARLPRVDRP